MSFDDEWKAASSGVSLAIEIEYTNEVGPCVACTEVLATWREWERLFLGEGNQLTGEAFDCCMHSLGYRDGIDPQTGLWSWKGIRKAKNPNGG